MNFFIYKMTLDMHEANSQVMFNAKVDDSKRKFIFSLADGGKPYTITNDCTAVFRGKKPDGTYVYNNCTIEDNAIIYELTNQTVAAEGIVECEIELIGGDNKKITSPRFSIRATNTEYSSSAIESQNEFTALTTRINEANNLNAAVSKSGDVVTITITKKDGTTQTATVTEPDMTNYYTKTEVNTRLNNKQDAFANVTEEAGDSTLAPESGKQVLLSGRFRFTPDPNADENDNDIVNRSMLAAATANFITASVNNLVNYYLKSETYTKTEVNNLIGAIQTAHFEIVQTLPVSGESNVIYLVPRTSPETGNIYDEYIWLTNIYEKIGSTEVDLTGYATESWVNTQIANFLTQTQIESLISTALTSYYTKTAINALLDGKENIIRDITPYIDYSVDSETDEITITNLKSGVTPASLVGRFNIPSTIDNKTVTTIGGTCFYNCVNADFILPSTLTTIEDGTATSSLPAYAHGAFSNTKITNADPNPNMYVGEGAFYNCDYITSLHIPNGVTLGNACFIGCNNIKKVVIDEGITNTGSNTFSNNTSLFELLLPETLTTVGNAAFLNTKLKTLYLPKSVTTMAPNAFSNVVLTELYFGGTEAEFNAKSYKTIFTSMSGIMTHYNCKPAIIQDIYDCHDSTKQDKLTAGTNITIDENNVISASGGGGTWRKIYEKTLTAQDEAQEITINTDLNGNDFVLSDVKIFVFSPIDTEQKQGYIQIKEDRTDTGAVTKQFGIITFARTTYKNQMLAEGHTSTDFVSYFNIGSGVPGSNLMTPNGFTPSNNPPANFSKIEWIKLRLNSGNFKEGTYIIISGLDKV